MSTTEQVISQLQKSRDCKIRKNRLGYKQSRLLEGSALESLEFVEFELLVHRLWDKSKFHKSQTFQIGRDYVPHFQKFQNEAGDNISPIGNTPPTFQNPKLLDIPQITNILNIPKVPKVKKLPKLKQQCPNSKHPRPRPLSLFWNFWIVVVSNP